MDTNPGSLSKGEMNRREWMMGALLAGTGLACEAKADRPNGPAGIDRSDLQTSITRLKLRHTWTTTMSSSEYRDTLSLRLSAQGVEGIGEGAPIVRYKESAESARDAVESIRPLLLSTNPWQFQKLMATVFQRVPGQYAAKAAIDIALFDWVAKK
jgi:L-alanine-DL-glutamate epimerase-like enolase superfamily enzyme